MRKCNVSIELLTKLEMSLYARERRVCWIIDSQPLQLAAKQNKYNAIQGNDKARNKWSADRCDFGMGPKSHQLQKYQKFMLNLSSCRKLTWGFFFTF